MAKIYKMSRPQSVTRIATIKPGKLKMSKPSVAPKVNMSKPAPKPAWKPQRGIPDQSKVKNIGVGWGGEKPKSKKR